MPTPVSDSVQQQRIESLIPAEATAGKRPGNRIGIRCIERQAYNTDKTMAQEVAS
ncbi:MAG: hypothetical protein PUP92_17535 [Rhizonema sp. PD38]|nr:hypothetical protein [Rhizonema sp. PD38]